MARRSKKQVPLIIEEHPDDYVGYPFITLLQYRDKHFLSIVDNADAKGIRAYILDFCGPESVDEEFVIAVAEQWYKTSGGSYPISFEFSKMGVVGEVNKIIKTFNIDFVTRVIGPLPKFPMVGDGRVKRRRKKSLPAGVEINKKVVQLR